VSKRFFVVWVGLFTILIGSPVFGPRHSDGRDWMRQSFSPAPPANPVRVIFIHHSTGGNWLSDENGGLGIALRDNNYFVSDTNYGWGLDNIGDNTDFGHWWLWFGGPDRSIYLDALYHEGDPHSSYSRLSASPQGENEIIMFKSCFPNSALQGNPDDPVPPIDNNPLRGEGSGSEHHTVANAKGIYIDLLEYFCTRQDKLFIVMTAPPLMSNETNNAEAANARAFNNWLVNEWLAGYLYKNVAVFDFYNVLTSNGGSANTDDAASESGNHHRWWNGAIQHIQTVNNNKAAYPTGDSHPSQAGNLKATAEFVNLLNVACNRWRSEAPPPSVETVSTPSFLSGPTSGSPGINYTYSAGGSSSNMDHPVQYLFDWGDETDSGWLPVGMSGVLKNWSLTGTYLVKVKAKCEIDPSVISNWSNSLTVEIINDGPDLTGQWTSLRLSCRTTRKGVKWKIQGKLNVQNIGTQNAPTSLVGFYLSDDGVSYDVEAPFKQMTTGAVKTNKSKVKSLSYSFPAGENIAGQYIIAVIDPGDTVKEIDKTNNIIIIGPIS